MNGAARVSFAGVLLTFGSFALAQEEVAQGQKLFESQCASCHTVKPGVNGFGPSVRTSSRRVSGSGCYTK
jgi:mono/diheme cytochrome c family protein